MWHDTHSAKEDKRKSSEGLDKKEGGRAWMVKI